MKKIVGMVMGVVLAVGLVGCEDEETKRLRMQMNHQQEMARIQAEANEDYGRGHNKGYNQGGYGDREVEIEINQGGSGDMAMGLLAGAALASMYQPTYEVRNGRTVYMDKSGKTISKSEYDRRKRQSNMDKRKTQINNKNKNATVLKSTSKTPSMGSSKTAGNKINLSKAPSNKVAKTYKTSPVKAPRKPLNSTYKSNSYRKSATSSRSSSRSSYRTTSKKR